MTHDDESFWRAKRELVAREPRKVNLNAGTLSPTPLPVLEAVGRLRMMQASDPSNFLWRESIPLVERARARLAEYLNCSSNDLLLLPNATLAINVIASSLPLPYGAEILTTDHEYGAMMYCWRRAAEGKGWRVRQVELPYRTEDPEEIVAALRAGITGETRAIYFSHVTTTTGLVLPAAAIARLARERGLTCIIDGAHGPGMVPVNLGAIDADFYTANCHKWMMAPAGAGFLHVAPRARAMLAPLVTSWGFEYDRAQPDAPSRFFPGTNWQANFEFHGTSDRCPQMAIPDALDFRESLGGDDSIRARSRELVAYARRRRRLSACGFAPATPENAQLSGALLALDFPCDDVVAARDRLYHEHDIECPVTSGAGRTFLRVSCAWFNSTEEIDRFADAVGRL